MLEPAKMMDGILMATSIYFANALKTRLIDYNENTWTMILLFSVTLCWFKIEHLCHLYKEKNFNSSETYLEVIFGTVSVISQTLSFLVIQFFISLIDGLILEQHLFMQAAVFPALMLLFCVLLVMITKKIERKYQSS